ncbi:MAG: hypothetical protein ACYDDA_10575 [Acidiferrobacteraceae bacterium]
MRSDEIDADRYAVLTDDEAETLDPVPSCPIRPRAHDPAVK